MFKNETLQDLRLPDNKTGLIYCNWGMTVRNEGCNVVASLTDGTPPLKFFSNGEVDIEFGPLLLVDYVVMDVDCYQQLMLDDRNIYSRLRKSLNILYEEEFLKLVSYSSIFEKHKDWVKSKTEESENNQQRWLKGIRNAISGWESGREPFREYAFEHFDMKIHIPLGIASYLDFAGEKLNEENSQRIRKILFSNKKKRTKLEKEVISACLRPYMNHVYSYMAVRDEIGLPVIDWHNMRELYSPVYESASPLTPVEIREQEKIRELFTILLPDFEPETPEEFLKLLRNKDIESLRTFITGCTLNEYEFHVGQQQNIIAKIHENGTRRNSAGRFLSLAALGGSIVATASGADPVASITIAGGISAIQEGGREAFDKLVENEDKWLYLILNNK